MKIGVCWTVLLLIVSLQTLHSRLPDFTPPTRLQLEVLLDLNAPTEPQKVFGRLPGLCRRLKRRRVTVLCHMETLCWARGRGRSQKTRSGQVCPCPRGSRCSHFFIHSL